MPRPTDRQLVTELLGRSPKGAFEVVVRHRDGTPLVIENAPLLDDGTPMPTRWWLVGEPERTWVGRVESAGGVGRAEAAVEPEQLAAVHARYARERDALIPTDHEGPRPFGGVGGTRRGVKCLHAHYAWWLAGGDDPVGAWVADRLAEQGYGADVSEQQGRVAAIDCGTNSTRLLVAERHGDGSLVTLDRRMHITRLGQGVDATGRLASEAIERTLEVLADYRAVIDDFGVTAIRATATSAARDAANRDDFLGPVGALLGVEPELLSGAQEATLSFAGATAELTGEPGTYLVVDIGGGSTEFAAGIIDESGNATTVGAESVDVGCVRMTERFLISDPPTDTELAAATAHCDRVVAGVLDRIRTARHATHLVGLAGTVSTLAAVDLGITEYDRDLIHHHTLHADRVGELTRSLLRRRAEDRRSVPGMEPGRIVVIAGGLVVLASVLAATGHDRLLVSEADILDGLAASLLR